MPKTSIGNIRLFHESTGKGRPILFLHGLGSSGKDWEEQVAFFAHDYEVITVDLRGHGKSDKPLENYSTTQLAEDVAMLAETLDIGPVHLVGLSLGGAVALELAIQRPELIASLTVVNMTSRIQLETSQEKAEFLKRLLVTQAFGMEGIGRVLSARLFPYPGHRQVRAKFVRRWKENHKPAYIKAMTGLVGWNAFDRLSQIRCPTLIVSSDRDYWPIEEKQRMASAIPKADLVVVRGAYHALPVEQPWMFNTILAKFLQRSGVNHGYLEYAQ